MNPTPEKPSPRRRWPKRLLWTGAVLATLVVLCYQIANWRGAAAWKDAQERLVSEGESLSLSDLVPEKTPEADNFFATPALLDIAKVDGGNAEVGPHAEQRARLSAMNPRHSIDGVEAKPPRHGPNVFTPTDFAPWIEYVQAAKSLDLEGIEGDTPAARILDALDRAHGELFDELAQASSRQGSSITPPFAELSEGKRFYNISVPHYGSLQSLAAALLLRGAAAAQSGDVERAEESIRILTKLAEGCRKDPILIGVLVAISFDEMRHRMLWEMVNAGTCDTASLERLQREIGTIDHQTAMLNAVRGELFGALDAMDWIEDDGLNPTAIMSADGEPQGAAAKLTNLTPQGWIDQNRSYFANWYLDYAIIPLKKGDLREAVNKAEELDQLLIDTKAGGFHPHKVMPMIAMPTITSIVRKVVYAETKRRIELVACALERYRLENGSYPDSLGQLSPKFIAEVPGDPCAADGETLNYRTEEERYRIWSIGLDGDDDGGVPDKDPKMRPTREKYDGDWVWRFVE